MSFYMRKAMKLTIVFLLFVIVILFSTCGRSMFIDQETEYGSLRIFTPTEWPSDIVNIQVIGNGPSERSYNSVFPVSDSPIFITNILAGPWTFFVFALDADSTQVMAGQVSGVVEDGGTNDFSVILTPINGTGILSLEFNWPVDALANPAVEASLSHYLDDGDFETPETLSPFEYSEIEGIGTFRYEGVHAAGYYLLETRVDDDMGTLWSQSDALLIAYNKETPVTINLATGSVEIQIILSPSEPLEVVVTPDIESPIALGTDIIISSSVSGGTPPYSYRWYLNGQILQEETGASIITGSELLAGRYRLTLVVSDSEVLGSAVFVFDVIP